MKRWGLTLCVKPDQIETYKRYHEAVWPEVEQGLVRAGIRQMTIWLIGNRLFMYALTDDDFDWSTSLAEYEKNPRCYQWQRLMESLQEPAPEAGQAQGWALMEEVYHLEG